MQKFNTVAMQKLLSRHCMHADIPNQYDSYSYCVPHGHHVNGLFSLHCHPKIGQNRSSPVLSYSFPHGNKLGVRGIARSAVDRERSRLSLLPG